MKLQEIKDYIRETIYKTDKDYANVVFYLIKNGFAGKPLRQIEEGDIDTMFDNVCINSEIVNKDNIEEYDAEFLVDAVGKISMNKIKRDENLFLVLNYYDANSVKRNSRFVFKYGYDVIG